MINSRNASFSLRCIIFAWLRIIDKRSVCYHRDRLAWNWVSRSSPNRPHAPLEQDGMDKGHFTTRDTTITLYYKDLEIVSNTREGSREHYEKQKTHKAGHHGTQDISLYKPFQQLALTPRRVSVQSSWRMKLSKIIAKSPREVDGLKPQIQGPVKSNLWSILNKSKLNLS